MKKYIKTPYVQTLFGSCFLYSVLNMFGLDELFDSEEEMLQLAKKYENVGANRENLNEDVFTGDRFLKSYAFIPYYPRIPFANDLLRAIIHVDDTLLSEECRCHYVPFFLSVQSDRENCLHSILLVRSVREKTCYLVDPKSPYVYQNEAPWESYKVYEIDVLASRSADGFLGFEYINNLSLF